MTCPYCGSHKIYICLRVTWYGSTLSLCLDDGCLEMSVEMAGYNPGIPFWPLGG